MWLLLRHLFVTHLIFSKRSWSPCIVDRLAVLSSTHVCMHTWVHHAGKDTARFCDPLIQPGRNWKNSSICNSLSWETKCEAWPHQFPAGFQIKLSLDHCLYGCPEASPTLVTGGELICVEVLCIMGIQGEIHRKLSVLSKNQVSPVLQILLHSLILPN